MQDDYRPSRSVHRHHRSKPNDFYIKLERIRSSRAVSNFSQYRQRTATDLLNESKAFFVKTEAVLNNRQTLFNAVSSTLVDGRCFRGVCRSPPPRSDPSIRALDSISLLSLSDQTTLNSMQGPSAGKRSVIPSSISVIERNARIIKWLFQLHQANSSPSFADSSSLNVVNNSD